MSTVSADKRNGQIDPAKGIKEFIEGSNKAYGRKGEQNDNHK
ncbi:hypothetical protein BROSI_A0099 [Candidatus Brocadia sinica JPN1]|uniref:Uncharacterized protein n=1 Tax=Candidatus Brocadia sinica JPN1 TaxID=1197129 RepID=A0ABQ0JS87_9BACT|nr:hypothetical protein BROSI_A0099 [Candidatus Brocadia sinica JPN1]GIK12431.1 MAG: hypothetical protein BroJett002_11380 [Candidatus Brocadia sinica]GJQ17876.1 MAG: hypothetical protein HBSIN01_18350 [Candidatus Brocadia sinica]